MSELEIKLEEAEARVLGCLMEKQVLTPDAYPLTLNYLKGACNQKTSRDPVMELEEEEVAQAILGLRKKGLAVEMKTAEGRVLKYSHRLEKLGAFSGKEQAALCLLMLRGPQTAGEIKGRSERLAEFASIEDAESVLEALAQKSAGAMAAKLARKPGTKEQRWAHLLCGEPKDAETAPAPKSGLDLRVAALEKKVDEILEMLKKR